MMKDFFKRTLHKISSSRDCKLTLLKWLVMYQNCTLFRDGCFLSADDSMVRDITDSCKKTCHDKLHDHIFSTYKYLDFIYGDLMESISEQIKSKEASDYDILLYVYLTLTKAHPIPTDEKMINGGILNTIIWNALKNAHFVSVFPTITYKKYKEYVDKKFKKFKDIFIKDIFPVDIDDAFVHKFAQDGYKKFVQKFPPDTKIGSIDDIIDDEYEKNIQNTADDIYRELTENIMDEREIIWLLEQERSKKVVEDVANKKYEEFFQIFKDNKYDDFIGKFAYDIRNVLDKRFPHNYEEPKKNTYEEFIKNIADDVCKKISDDITTDRQFIGRHCEEILVDIILNKYDDLVRIFANDKRNAFIQRFIQDINKKLAQRITQDICDRFIQKISQDRYDRFVQKFADHSFKKFIKNISEYDSEFYKRIDTSKSEGFIRLPHLINDEFCEEKGYFESKIFEEYIIYILYLWLADAGILVEYNSKIKTFYEDNKTIFDPEKDNADVVKLWEKCKKEPSRYNYYHYHKYSEGVKPHNPHENLKNHFVQILLGINESAYTFLPSFITLIINNLEPSRHRGTDIDYICDFKYSKYMPYLEHVTNDFRSFDAKSISVFLKLIITFENFSYNGNRNVETCFNRKKEKIKTGKKFNFYFSYFNIFFRIHYMREESILKKHSGCSIDLTLSLLHLNIFTRWYDAYLLIEGMPFEFLKYNSLYLKLLTIPSIKFEDYTFLDMVEELIKITDIDLKQALTNKGSPIGLEKIASLFYQKSREKICDDDLIDVLYANKNSTEKRISEDINPIYKLIYLLDNPDLDYKQLQKLLYEL